MIRLTNIQKNNDYISCLAFVEDSKESFQLIYNIKNEDFDSYLLPKGYEWCKSHIAHAKRFMETILNKNEYPHEELIMWY